MALEKDVIVGKLKEEGINETLGNGLSFETDEELTSWVDTYKSGLPTPEKKLQDYTKEEIEELSKDPQFKGAKGLQGFIDSIRNKKTDPKPTPDTKPDDAMTEMLKAIQDELKELKGSKQVESFEKLLGAVGKSEGLSETHISRVKKGLKSDATEAEIKAEIASYKKELTELGIKEFGTPGAGSKNNIYRPSESLSGKYAERYKKKHSKK